MFARHSETRIPITPYRYELNEQNEFPDECSASLPRYEEDTAPEAEGGRHPWRQEEPHHRQRVRVRRGGRAPQQSSCTCQLFGQELPVDRTQALTAPTEKEDLSEKDEAPCYQRIPESSPSLQDSVHEWSRAEST